MAATILTAIIALPIAAWVLSCSQSSINDRTICIFAFSIAMILGTATTLTILADPGKWATLVASNAMPSGVPQNTAETDDQLAISKHNIRAVYSFAYFGLPAFTTGWCLFIFILANVYRRFNPFVQSSETAT